jgi:hypothetical protein
VIDRWIRAFRPGWIDALVPADLVKLAVDLKIKKPLHALAQVRRILAARPGWALSERAIQRLFAARNLA